MTDRFKFRVFYKDFPLCDAEKGRSTNVGNAFDIEPFNGDWKDSLIVRGEV